MLCVDSEPSITEQTWNVTSSIEYTVALIRGAVDLRVEDAFHKWNPGPFYTDNPASRLYYPRFRPGPSMNS